MCKHIVVVCVCLAYICVIYTVYYVQYIYSSQHLTFELDQKSSKLS